MYTELNTLGVPDFNYFSLRRKSDGVEVYTSPEYKLGDSDAFDFNKIISRLDFYFERVNSGIIQKLESNKLTMEEKIQLRMLLPSDFEIWYQKFMPVGMAKCVFWKEDYAVWTKFPYIKGEFCIVPS